MKKSIIYSTLFTVAILVHASILAEPIVHKVPSFEKIIVSPHIRLVLEPGDEESVLITETKVEESKINVKVVGRTLRIYLDKAKDYTKHKKNRDYESKYGSNKRPMYLGTLVTAKVTYKDLKKMSIRGEEDVECLGLIKSKKFKLKVFGEADVNIASIESQQLKTALYGENKIKFHDGRISDHKIKAYGDNNVDLSKLVSTRTRTTSFGVSNLNLNAKDKVKITAFGESEFNVTGGAKVYRGIVIGENRIYEYIPKSTQI